MESSGSQGVGANINSFSHLGLVDVNVKMQVVNPGFPQFAAL